MTIKMRFLCTGVVACFFLIGSIFSQSLPLKNYKDGLPSSFVTCIIQDSSGYIWLGTEHGLGRFNGRESKTFTDEAHGLKNDYIIRLFEDHKDNLWVGTRDAGLVEISPVGIISYTTRDGLPSNRISEIAEDRFGNLWLGTHSGLCRFDGKTFTTYKIKDGLINEYINAVVIDTVGNLWIGTGKGVSYLTIRKGGQEVEFANYTRDHGLIDDNVTALMIDHEGNTWMGTRGGVSCYKKGGEEKKPAFISYSTREGLANNIVYTLLEDRDSNIWIGTEGGVSLFSSGKFTNFYTKNGFPHDKIYSIFEDREGNLWFGTRMGVGRLHSLRITNFTVTDGLPDNYTWAIIEENKDKYWIGTDKGLCCYSEGIFKTYTTADGLINNSVYSLLEDGTGNLWIATKGGLSAYSPGKGVFTNYTEKDGLPDDVVLSLAKDKSGTTWIGTLKGICRFFEGRILPHPFAIPMGQTAVHAILPDSRGNLWFSDTQGLYKISGETSTYYTTQNGLSGDYVYSLFEDSRHRIWIGTKQGLSCCVNGRFTNYTTADGLSDNACLFILEDTLKNLWIGTVKGMNRFDGKSFKTYTSRDGLVSTEMSHSTSLKDTRGNLWFCTPNGLTRFDPRLDRPNTIPPPVYITQLEVMGKPHPLSDIRLKHDENYLKFDFIGLCYTSPEDVVYKYRLEGTDSHWFETRDPYISYPSLNPGTYTFKVIAKNNDGVESLEPAEIRFKILPPFWQTWWFKALVALVLLTLVVIFILVQNKRLKARVEKEENKKQLVMAQRMKLMGVLAGGAVHDLKNLLSIIIGYTNLVHEYGDEVDEEEKNEAFSIIKSTADTAFQVVKQILAFTRQTEDETKPTNSSDALGEILTILKITIPPTLKILWVPPHEEINLYINPIKFKQVVMNVCLNAVQAMGEKGVLKIILEKDPIQTDRLCIEVTDTGPGIPAQYLDKIFDPLFTTKEAEKGSGLGLFVVKQIVDEYQGEIRVDTKEGEGTTFKIYFPVQPPPIQDKN